MNETRPYATERTRLRWKMARVPNKQATGFVKVRVPLKDETVRSAACPEHNCQTIDFTGVNEHGWIFRCKGPQYNTQGKLDGYLPHYFVAQAPK